MNGWGRKGQPDSDLFWRRKIRDGTAGSAVNQPTELHLSGEGLQHRMQFRSNPKITGACLLSYKIELPKAADVLKMLKKLTDSRRRRSDA